jgi:hypothetical protein
VNEFTLDIVIDRVSGLEMPARSSRQWMQVEGHGCLGSNRPQYYVCRMKKLADLLVTALLAIPLTASNAEAFDALEYGACAGPVRDHLIDGGLAFPLTGVAAHGRSRTLYFLYEYGSAGPAEYLSPERARLHEQLLERAPGWLVVANRSMLDAVKRGELPHAVADESDPSRTTIWFGKVFVLQPDDSCRALWTFPGLLQDDFSPSIWVRLQAFLEPAAAI